MPNNIDKVQVNNQEISGFLGTSYIENSEYIKVMTDSEGLILEGIRQDGTKLLETELQINGEVSFNNSIHTPIENIEFIDNKEWLKVTVDKDGKISEGVRKDGSKYFGKIDGVPTQNSVNILSNKVTNFNNSIPHFEKILIENSEYNHSTGYTYTAFGDGCTFRGLEIYVQRCGVDHFTDLENKGKIVFYTRQDDGSFSHKFAPLDYDDVTYEYRDPHISVTRGGDYLILACFATGQNAASFLWILDRQFNIVYGKTTICPSTHVVWGKVIQTPTGHFICTCYKNSNGVDLFRSTGTSVDNFGTFENVATIFPSSDEEPNEAALVYWGNKLICIAR